MTTQAKNSVANADFFFVFLRLFSITSSNKEQRALFFVQDVRLYDGIEILMGSANSKNSESNRCLLSKLAFERFAVVKHH